ncbi:hypothetical protein DSECCO2_127010 [anaerobic digester metagenome]
MVKKVYLCIRIIHIGYNLVCMTIAEFVKEMRKEYGLTQIDLSMKTGVGIRFIRELESGKPTVRLDKVNQVLALFEAEVGVQQKRKDE